ncbi:MAG: phage terminase large subunit [Prevotellaceae bacterium]|jgi:phage terminase large subunit|nr:phage terminase large subunit [Prevotellaceae bacterium]
MDNDVISLHKINKAFKQAFHTDKQIIDCVGGRGRGASFFGTQYFLLKIISAEYFRGVFLRRVQADIRNSLFQDFKDRLMESGLTGLFKINENEMTFVYKPNGNKIISKGAVKETGRSANMKSLAGFTHILIEEANELEQNDYDTLIVSLRTTKSETKVIRLFNPPAESHWIWQDYNLTECAPVIINGKKEVFWNYTPKSTSDIEMIKGTYNINIDNINEKAVTLYESYKEKNPVYYYNQICGLITGGMKGRVYSGWNKITAKEFEEIDCRPVYVVDFGYFPDPTACIQVKWRANEIFVRELIYETGLDDLMLAKLLLDKGVTYRDLIIADYGNGGTLRIATFLKGGGEAWRDIDGYPELRKGFSMKYAKKGSGSVAAGVKTVQGLVVSMTEDSVNGWREYQNYIWATDRDGNTVGVPVDKDNHVMDDIRYFAQYRIAYAI